MQLESLCAAFRTGRCVLFDWVLTDSLGLWWTGIVFLFSAAGVMTCWLVAS